MRVVVRGQPVAHLDVDPELALIRPSRHVLGEPDVTLRIRRVLEQLAVVVAIALGRLDLRRAFEIEHPLLAALVGREAPGRADREDQVVAWAVADRPEVGVEQALALVDVEHLVRLAVAVEDRLRHRLGRADDAHHDVVVEEQRDPAADRVAVRLDARRIDEAVVVIAVVGLLELEFRARPARSDASGSAASRDRAASAAGEALDAEQLLGVERPIRARCCVWRVGGMLPRAA